MYVLETFFSEQSTRLLEDFFDHFLLLVIDSWGYLYSEHVHSKYYGQNHASILMRML